MSKQKFYVNEDELDNFQVKLIQKRIDRSMIVCGCAGSGKSILALWKAKQLQDKGESYKFIVFTKALHKFMLDGIRSIGLNDDNFYYHRQWVDNGAPEADYIIVDEVQDFNGEQILQFKNAAKKAFFFWGDHAQMMYRSRQPIHETSAQMGIMPETLVFNHRLPKKIARFASHLNCDEELVQRCENEGTEFPRILRYNSLEEQLDVVMNQIDSRHISASAILFPTNKMVRHAYDYLRKKGHLVEAKFDDDENSELTLDFENDNPKLLTYHSSKGLQFEAVFLPQCNAELEKWDITVNNTTLYVAITRSYRYLFIMYSSNLVSYFSLIPNNLYSTALEEARIEL